MHPDLAARKALVAAYLYYVLDAPTISDAEFDQLCQTAADGWDQLDPVRQWQLESPEATRASGAHFKFTAATLGAARHAYWKHYGRYAPQVEEKWKRERKGALRYVTAVA